MDDIRVPSCKNSARLIFGRPEQVAGTGMQARGC
jgi:hypothetical protein